MKYFKILLACLIPIAGSAQNTMPDRTFKKHTFSKGLVMAGYQGWFNTPEDGADRGWHHYQRKGRFEPGYCTIDFWPDMSEYEKKYNTAFEYASGTTAQVFSSYDESTVELHFKWMKDYNIDGVFMQRFVAEVRNPSGKMHFNKVLESANKAALKNDRALSIMYDLSGMRSGDTAIVKKDWKEILEKYGYDDRSKYGNYLFNDQRPVIGIWGVGFNDNRKYDLEDIKALIRFFKSEEGGRCDVLLGVPAYWRELGRDCIKDPKLHKVIRMADIVHPWFVGRFNEDTYPSFKNLIGKDQQWCDAHDLKYMPVAFPGFSWNNMLPPGRPDSTIPRNEGSFFWKQLRGVVTEGAHAIYIAMFDEIDEGTAIFKVAHRVPVGKSTFVYRSDKVPSDYYLWLTGLAATYLKQDKILPERKPEKQQ
ncbi:glycoside hydrolase family 71/99-like protein [Sinomicrobium sp. M5D2P17]